MVQVTANGCEYIGTGDAPSTKSSAEDYIAVTLQIVRPMISVLGMFPTVQKATWLTRQSWPSKSGIRGGLKPDNLLSLHPKRQRDLDSYGQFGTLINRDLLAQRRLS